MIFRPLLLTLAATAALTALAPGQQLATPAQAAGEAAPSGGVVTPSTPVTETPLIPDEAPSLVKPEEGTPATPAAAAAKTGKVSKTETFEKEILEKIRYREAKTKALADPAVIAAWDLSNVAKVDVDKRNHLKAYYKLLFARIVKIDPTLKTMVALKALEADHRVTQARLSPTIEDPASESSSTSTVLSAR